jgi:hypothetical protein
VLPPPRPAYTHSSHTDATAAAAPPAEPIDLHSNPDVLALKSAISILQIQRRKAERDMVTLNHVRSAALAEPEAFVQDLTAGRVRVEGERLLVGGVRDEDSDSDSDSDGESKSDGDNDGDKEKEKDSIMSDNNNEEKQIKSDGSAQTESHPQSQPTTEIKYNVKTDPQPWTSIPKPQNIVRCPPINWSQYAVVGESLDKLHNEQVLRPAQGTPAVLTSEGHFEFKGGDGGGVGKQERYIGVAAPYTPGKDKIDRKAKR